MKTLAAMWFKHPVVLAVLLLANGLGTVYGFWWYRYQFMITPVWLWPFVPNSPLSSMYFFIALVCICLNKRSVFWESLAFFGLIKHGLWTVAIISGYELAGYPSPENFMLLSGHLAMALQAVLFWFLYGLPLSRAQALGVSVWYLFDDYLDYGIGIYPYVDTSIVSLAFIRSLAVGSSIILCCAYLITARKREQKKAG